MTSPVLLIGHGTGRKMDKPQDFTADRGPARTAPRDSLFLLTNITTPEGASLGKARVRNLSAVGLMADCERPIASGMRIAVDLRGVGRVLGTVAWARADKIGMAFDDAIDPQLARKPVGANRSEGQLPDYLRPLTNHRR
jgi:hypothetical protein